MTQQATKSAAIIGGGVIGGGWAARFLLMGWNVQVFDPDPEAQRKISEVIDNARRSLPGLSDVALPEEGELSFHDTMSEAVAGVTWIQESVPERLELKRKVYQTLQEHCPVDAIIGSSTSGFKPSELQGCATRPEQIVVTHPFNPVYLLPLIELVPTAQNSPEFIAQAKEILTEIGMFRYMCAPKSTPISLTVFLRPSGARRFGLSKTASPPRKKSTTRSGMDSGCAGPKWACSKPTASQAVRRACAIYRTIRPLP